MFNKITKGKQDEDNLSERAQSASVGAKKVDYRNVVVNKPWGYEYLMFENEHVAIWILHLKKGARTSMHCHPKKKTSLLVLEGQVTTASLCDEFTLQVLESLMIDAGAFHATGTDFDTGSFIMEIETPPEKTDLVRLQDSYGREHKGYEGGEDIVSDLQKYEHHSFHDDVVAERAIIEKAIRRSRVLLHTREDWESLKEEVSMNAYCIVSFLDTALHDENGNIVLDIGDICEGEWLLSEYEKLHPSEDSFTVMTIH